MFLTMPDSLSWTVVCQNQTNRFCWLYVFSRNGTVRWKDEGNGMSGDGAWQIRGDKLLTRWRHSSTTETWKVPIEPSNWTGKCTMKGMQYDLTAVARNYLPKYTPTQFLEMCDLATNKLLTAQLNFCAWLSTAGSAYAAAFEAHNEVLDTIAAKRRLQDEIILGLALAFLGGGVGGVVGGLVRDAMQKSVKADLIIDGIKDLTKYTVRQPVSALLRGPGLKPAAKSPLQWQDSINARVMSELSIVSQGIYDWRRAIMENDPNFSPAFDPDKVVSELLTIHDVSLLALPPIDTRWLKGEFEQGMLVGWIKNGKTYVEVGNFADVSNRKTLSNYGHSLGLSEIDALLDEYWPILDPPPAYGGGP